MNVALKEAVLPHAIDDLCERVRTASTAREAFYIILDAFKPFGFVDGFVNDSVLSINVNRQNGRALDSLCTVFSSFTGERHDEVAEFFASQKSLVGPPIRRFSKAELQPFASGPNWYEGTRYKFDDEEQAFFNRTTEFYGSYGAIIFPFMSPQTELVPAASLTISGQLNRIELKTFLQNVAPSFAKVIKAFEEKIYPHLEQIERDRVGLSEREIECLNRVANGYTSVHIAEILGISVAMVDRHVRKSRTKLRVVNTPSAVLKAKQLGLIAF